MFLESRVSFILRICLDFKFGLVFVLFFLWFTRFLYFGIVLFSGLRFKLFLCFEFLVEYLESDECLINVRWNEWMELNISVLKFIWFDYEYIYVFIYLYEYKYIYVGGNYR